MFIFELLVGLAAGAIGVSALSRRLSDNSLVLLTIGAIALIAIVPVGTSFRVAVDIGAALGALLAFTRLHSPLGHDDAS